MVNYSRALPVDSSKVQNHHHLIHPFDAQIHFVLEGKIQIRSVSIVQSPSQTNQIYPNQRKTLLNRAIKFESLKDKNESKCSGIFVSENVFLHPEQVDLKRSFYRLL